MDALRISIEAAYFATMGLLAIYGLHRLYLLTLFWKHRNRAQAPPQEIEEPPFVTVQIPLYNECNVAERSIDAVCRLDYPSDRLEIQLLDDSTDETTARVAELAARWRGRGRDVRVLHRTTRRGFKAGALAEGLAQSRGEFIAVFDADFVPPSDFLRRTLPPFEDAGVGMVQARWGHLNRNSSALTRVQALLLDGHFLIEHAARHLSGLFFNFNGTAGIWRRACIAQAGGWQPDTLTEDLDLSYRAQLAGWRFVFLSGIVAPGELPVEMSAFRCQQHRWAKGSIQTARKLLPRLLSSRLPARVRAEAFLHLTANFGFVIMLLYAILLVPAMLLRLEMSLRDSLLMDIPLLLFSSVSYWLFYAAAGKRGGRGFGSTIRTLPMLMAVSVGLSLNNSRAVLEGLFGSGGTFERTPKHNVMDGAGARPVSVYRTRRNHVPWVDGVLVLYFTAGIVIAVWASLWPFLPLLALFWSGFAYTCFASAKESWTMWRVPGPLSVSAERAG